MRRVCARTGADIDESPMLMTYAKNVQCHHTVLFDFAVAAHVCPSNYATESPLHVHSEIPARGIVTADASAIYGRRTLRYQMDSEAGFASAS